MPTAGPDQRVVNVTLPRETHRRLKIASVVSDRSMNALIRAAVEKSLAGSPAETARRASATS